MSKLTAKWIFGDEEGMLQKDVAELLCISDSSLRHYIRRHNLETVKLSQLQKKQISKQRGVNCNNSKLVPRKTIDQLVKIVDTPAAWSTYGTLLKSIRNPEKNVELQLKVKKPEEVQEYIKILQSSLETQKRELMETIDKKFKGLEKIIKQHTDDVKKSSQSSILTKPEKQFQRQSRTQDEIEMCGEYLRYLNDEYKHLLSDEDKDKVESFAEHFNRYDGRLTDKQMYCVQNIYKKTANM